MSAEATTATHEVRKWDRGTFGVMELRTRAFSPEDTWLTLSEALARCEEYNRKARRGER